MDHPICPPNRTLLQFSVPERPSFSWTDYLHVLTLTDDDLNQLMTECSYAAAVLKEERERRQGGRGERKKLVREGLAKHFQKFTGPPFEHVDSKLLEPMTDSTRWLIARLTGLDFSSPRLSRMALCDQAGVVRLALNSSLYPPIDERLPEESPIVASNLTYVPYLTEPKWDLAKLIYYAGNNVPSFFFSTQNISWGKDGEIETREMHSKLPLKYLQDLERSELLHVRQSSGQAMYSLYRLVADEIPRSTSMKSAGEWRMRALKHVCYIFPRNGETEPITYTQKGDSLLPILRKLAPHVWSDPTEWNDADFLAAAFEAFLAATNFGDFTWKIQAIQVAERLALLKNDYVDLARVAFRHHALRRIHPLRPKQPSLPLSLNIGGVPAANKRSNAFIGQLTLLKVQALIDERASSADVYKATQTFQVLDPQEVSPQENLMLLQNRFLYAKSLRFNGKFDQAAEILKEAQNTAKQLNSPLTLKIVVQYAELESERGNHDVALQFLEQDQEYLGSVHIFELGPGKRLALALAYAYLMRALDNMMQTERRGDSALEKAAGLFKWLKSVYADMDQVGLAGKQSIFQACCGLAMIYHVRKERQHAFDSWEEAKAAACRFQPEPGYAFMIATYSQSQLAFQLHREDAVQLYEQAEQVWAVIGRRRCHHLTGLGTMWPDWIGSREEEQSRQRLIPLRQQS